MVDVKKVVKYAGKDVEVVKKVSSTSKEAQEHLESKDKAKVGNASLDALVAMTQGTKDISTVEKSSYDWDQFKAKNNVGEELEEANRKNGYLQKQDFLNRVDQRQFELEKAQRERERVKRMASAKKK